MTPLRNFAIGLGAFGLIVAAALTAAGTTGFTPLGRNRWDPGDLGKFDVGTFTPAAVSPAPQSSATPAPQGMDPALLVADIVVTVVVCVLLLTVSLLVVLLIRRAIRQARLRRSGREGMELEPLEFDEAQAAADVQEALATTHAALLRGDGDVDQVIVACWRELEALAARHGRPRTDTQSSTEFASMFLQRTGADPAAVDDLATLYRQVQFSSHPADEADRQRALASLRAVMTSFKPDVR